MWPSHTRRESRHHTTAVIRQLLTPAIVAGEMPERGRDPIRGGDHGFQTEADGVQRPSGRVAAGSRRRWSAGRREDRAALHDHIPQHDAEERSHGHALKIEVRGGENKFLLSLHAQDLHHASTGFPQSRRLTPQYGGRTFETSCSGDS